MDMYKPMNGQFNRKVVTKLLNNYRSHEGILSKPNELFYNNELKVIIIIYLFIFFLYII